MSVTASLAFGNVAVGQTLVKTVTFTNTGAAHPLIVSGVTPSDAEYAVSGTGTCGALPVTVGPKSSCAFGIAFSPSSVGAHGASLSVSDNTSTSPQLVTLSGTGIAGLSTSKTSLVYGSVRFGLKGVASFSVTNHQTQPVSLNESFRGPNATDFSITGGTCTSTLAASSSCTLTVAFKPGVLGTESATLTISDSPDPLSPYMVALSTGPTIPDTVLPATVLYGSVYVAPSKPAKTKNITVTDLSPFALTTSIGSIGGANAADFAVTGGTCSGTLAGNSSCTYAVTFKPSAKIVETANVAVSVSNDPTSPHNVNLTGTGI